jgi:hypothetical protein
MKTFNEFMSEAQNDFAKPGAFNVPGIQTRFLVKKTVEVKDFEFTDSGFVSRGSAYLGMNSKKVWTIVFYSADIGLEASIKNFPDEASARKTFGMFAKRAQTLVKLQRLMGR